MKYIIVDPDEENCIDLKKLLDDYETLSFQGSFNTYGEAEKNIRGEPSDIAFIWMGKAEINAFRLVSVIRSLNLFSKVILLGNHEDYAVEAFECEADGFLLFPFEIKKIKQMLMKVLEIFEEDLK